MRARLAAALAARQRVEGERHAEVEVRLRVAHYVVVVLNLLPMGECSARCLGQHPSFLQCGAPMEQAVTRV